MEILAVLFTVIAVACQLITASVSIKRGIERDKLRRERDHLAVRNKEMETWIRTDESEKAQAAMLRWRLTPPQKTGCAPQG